MYMSCFSVNLLVAVKACEILFDVNIFFSVGITSALVGGLLVRPRLGYDEKPKPSKNWLDKCALWEVCTRVGDGESGRCMPS